MESSSTDAEGVALIDSVSFGGSPRIRPQAEPVAHLLNDSPYKGRLGSSFEIRWARFRDSPEVISRLCQEHLKRPCASQFLYSKVYASQIGSGDLIHHGDTTT